MRRIGGLLLLVLVFFAGALLAQDRDLDLPVEPKQAAPVQTKTYTGVGRTVTRDPRTIPAPPEKPPVQPDPKPPMFYGSEIKGGQRIGFVLDVSGSMGYDAQPYGDGQFGNRLDRAKAELVKTIGNLTPDFSFDVLAYDCASSAVFEMPKPAEAAIRAAGCSWVNARTPGGGTGTGWAVALALHDWDPDLVVLLTDGIPNCCLNGLTGGENDCERHRAVIRAANTRHVPIEVFGISATGEWRAFCVNIATDSGGTYHDVR